MTFEEKNLNKDDVSSILPHRYPFDFIDSVDVKSETTGCGVAVWPENHIIFDGHFPQFPIVPGVCLIEASAQVAGAIIGSQISSADRQSEVGVLAGVNKFTIHHPVLPNDRVEISVKLKRTFPRMGIAYAKGRIEDKEVFTAQVLLGVIPTDDLEKMMSASKTSSASKAATEADPAEA